VKNKIVHHLLLRMMNRVVGRIKKVIKAPHWINNNIIVISKEGIFIIFYRCVKKLLIITLLN
jgi:hypothetical protein